MAGWVFAVDKAVKLDLAAFNSITTKLPKFESKNRLLYAINIRMQIL